MTLTLSGTLPDYAIFFGTLYAGVGVGCALNDHSLRRMPRANCLYDVAVCGSICFTAGAIIGSMAFYINGGSL